jgi:hypothetical protein
MPRHHKIGTDITTFTQEEEDAQDAKEATWDEERPSRAMAGLRTERNALLDSSDWRMYADSPLDDDAKKSWALYRQELRDLPATEADPADPSWPEAPE